MKVLHVLETSIPHTVGYTVRARAIIEHQRRVGLDPVVVTSPFFPAKDLDVAVEQIQGTSYYRTNHIPVPASARSKVTSYAVRAMMVARYRQAILEIARVERPDVIHAHSSYTNAYAALPAARRLGVPLVYEVRTLWGESAVVENGLRRDSLKHRLVWQLELGAMRRADLVVPISRGIREELIRRGIPARKLEIVPNGVDSSRFQPVPHDHALAERIGLPGRFIIGFVGSILRLEGLSTLLEAYRICRSQRSHIGLVIVGDGPERTALQTQAREAGLRDVVFAGKVSHDDVSSWYSIMDALVYPRIRAVVNECVTPLKPLEAMALGKICVGSDVGGLKELIRDDDTGVIFRSEDPRDLASALLALMDDPARMQRLQHAASRFVEHEREWSLIVRRYVDLYDRLVPQKAVLAPSLVVSHDR
jgi:PEP-CTERM/exosortase A-associated glycosyltransferase